VSISHKLELASLEIGAEYTGRLQETEFSERVTASSLKWQYVS